MGSVFLIIVHPLRSSTARWSWRSSSGVATGAAFSLWWLGLWLALRLLFVLSLLIQRVGEVFLPDHFTRCLWSFGFFGRLILDLDIWG